MEDKIELSLKKFLLDKDAPYIKFVFYREVTNGEEEFSTLPQEVGACINGTSSTVVSQSPTSSSLFLC